MLRVRSSHCYRGTLGAAAEQLEQFPHHAYPGEAGPRALE